MFKLISLELRKYRFARMIGYAAMADLALLLFLALIGFTDYGAEDYAYSGYPESFELIDTFVRATFMIFAGGLLSRMIVGEYRNQTTSVLFTYPIKRRKLIAAKLIVILAFTFGVILFSDILLGSILVAADRYHPFVEDSLAMKQVQSMLNAYVVSSLSAAAMALIPLAFSMRKHSVTATMVSSVLLVLIVCSGFDGPLVSIDAALAIQLTLGVAGLAIAWLSMLRLETNDVN